MIRLNLLPKLQKRAMQREIFLRALFVLFLFAIVWTTVFFLFVVQSWIFIGIQNNALVERVRIEESAESAQTLIAFEEATARANKTIARVQKVSEAPVYDPVRIFDILSSLIPQGVALTTVDLDSDNNTLRLGGMALARDGVLLFEERLRGEGDMFAEVVAPLANILTPRDVSFSFTITLQE